MNEIKCYNRPEGGQLAYMQQPGQGVGILFLCGYSSDMQGKKVDFLSELCAVKQIPFTRFDYRGHGVSSGEFEEYTIGDWLDDTLNIVDHITSGRLLVIGSSMGGWLALRLAQLRPERICAMIGLAPAPDFTLDLFERDLNDAEQLELMQKGIVRKPAEFGEYIITKRLVDEARQHLMKGHLPDLKIPFHIIHGCLDAEVPWQQSVEILERYGADQVSLTLIKDGDHRLSRPQDLHRLQDLVLRVRAAN